MADPSQLSKDLYNAFISQSGVGVDKSLIDNAVTHESLLLVNRSDNVFTWLGPTIILGIFFLIVLLITISIAWYVDSSVTPGWMQIWGIVLAILSGLLFVLYYAVVSGTGKFVFAHIRR